MTIFRRAWHAALLILTVIPATGAGAVNDPVQIRIRDLATVEGVRENPLVGYGMIVGLNGSGDRQQTVFAVQTLAGILQRMGVQVPANSVRTKNVASVFVTANLPAFARPGTQVDVTVSSIGDAKSLEGGMLLLTALYGADGQVYAAAQGPLAVGGYSAGTAGNGKQVNHPTVGRIPAGGRVERVSPFNFDRLQPLNLVLREPDFTTAGEISDAINLSFGHNVAIPRDGGRVEINPGGTGVPNLTNIMARIENLSVVVHRRARVVVNERTGTVVVGQDVRLGAVSILHGGFSVQITTEVQVSQPEAFSQGKTAVVGQQEVQAHDAPVRHVEIAEGAKVEQLVDGLQNMGATARDIISILQAIKAAGALDADMEVI
jgi:flagellar P-ring protein precursor FlgI